MHAGVVVLMTGPKSPGMPILGQWPWVSGHWPATETHGRNFPSGVMGSDEPLTLSYSGYSQDADRAPEGHSYTHLIS